MRNLAIASTLLALPSFVLAQAPEASAPESLASKAALREFRQLPGSQWVVKWHPSTGTPAAIYGTGLKINDWRENSLAEARRHAEQVLRDNGEMLGLGSSDFKESIGARMGRTWTFTFEQSFGGVPVIDGRADVRINMAGVVSMLGSHAVPVPDSFVTVPTIGANVARGAAYIALGGEPAGTAPAPRLVIWSDTGSQGIAPFSLCWEVAVHELGADGSVGRYYVDASTGRVLEFRSDKHDCGLVSCGAKAEPVAPDAAAAADLAATPTVRLIEAPRKETALPTLTTVTLMAWTRTGNDAFSALQNVPLPNIVLNVPGIGQRTTDQNGEFEIDITAPVTISISSLDGVHHAPITGPSGPTGSVTVQPGVNATLQLLSQNASSAQAAHTTASYWTDRVNVWSRGILGNTAQLNTASNVGIDVNINQSCNAFYQGNTTNYYQQGGGCANTAFSTVVAHEWGHGLDDRYGGIANSNAEGVSEGWGDIIGMYLVDSPLLGSGFQSAGSPLRNGNNSRVFPYSSGSPHGAGQVWMGWAWRFREALRSSIGTAGAIALSNDLVIGSIAADATTREGCVLEVFLADDDDGNLLNGTPHYDELESASIQKGIPYPEIQLVAITHGPLSNTNGRLIPREVVCLAAPTQGAISQMQIVFDAGSGSVTRNMHPTGNNNQWIAMLPGIEQGIVDYRIEAVHSTGTTVRLPEAGNFSYIVDSGTFAGFYTEGFEGSAPGWTNGLVQTQNDWQQGAPAGDGGQSQGVAWADPSQAAVGNSCIGNDLGIGNFNGRYQSNVNNWLRSPVLDCTGRSGVRIRFRRWLTVEEAIYDQASLFCNGQLVWQNPQNGNLVDTSWQTVEYLVPWADNNPSVQFEWRLQSDAGLNLGGWTIDQVEVGETQAVMTDAELRFTPEQVVQGAPMQVEVTTPGNSRPYIIAVGDALGPTLVPGFPIIFAGGNLTLIGSATDASGVEVWNFNAPNIPSAVGVRFYSQVLTVDAAGTQFVTSNRSVNLITQTP
ncbi:MAG: hypothetical protein AB8H80_08035 [Planctomycetota bacterium]